MLVSGLSLGALSCGPKVDFLKQAPDFDYATLKGGRVVVCGVTTTVVPPDSATTLREPLTQTLEALLLEERPDLKLRPTKSLYSALGQDRYDTVLDDFEDSGEIRQAKLAALDSLIGQETRYIIVARIEDEEVSYDQSSTTDSDTDAETRTWTTTLKIRVAFHVYDIQSARSVWSATFTGKDDKENTYKDTDVTEGNFLGNLVSGLVEGILGLRDADDYPPPPGEAKILNGIFVKFASSLPRPVD